MQRTKTVPGAFWLAAVLAITSVSYAAPAAAQAVPQEDGRWFRLGAARQIAGDLAGAVAAYEKKLALDPYAANVRRTLTALREQLQEQD